MSIDALDHLTLFWCGFGAGILVGFLLALLWVASIACRILGERPIEVVRAWRK